MGWGERRNERVTSGVLDETGYLVVPKALMGEPEILGNRWNQMGKGRWADGSRYLMMSCCNGNPAQYQINSW